MIAPVEEVNVPPYHEGEPRGRDQSWPGSWKDDVDKRLEAEAPLAGERPRRPATEVQDGSDAGGMHVSAAPSVGRGAVIGELQVHPEDGPQRKRHRAERDPEVRRGRHAR